MVLEDRLRRIALAGIGVELLHAAAVGLLYLGDIGRLLYPEKAEVGAGGRIHAGSLPFGGESAPKSRGKAHGERVALITKPRFRSFISQPYPPSPARSRFFSLFGNETRSPNRNRITSYNVCYTKLLRDNFV